MAAVQVATTSGLLVNADSWANSEVTIQNLGPNAIYIEFGAAATTTGSLPAIARDSQCHRIR